MTGIRTAGYLPRWRNFCRLYLLDLMISHQRALRASQAGGDPDVRAGSPTGTTALTRGSSAAPPGWRPQILPQPAGIGAKFTLACLGNPVTKLRPACSRQLSGWGQARPGQLPRRLLRARAIGVVALCLASRPLATTEAIQDQAGFKSCVPLVNLLGADEREYGREFNTAYPWNPLCLFHAYSPWPPVRPAATAFGWRPPPSSSLAHLRKEKGQGEGRRPAEPPSARRAVAFVGSSPTADTADAALIRRSRSTWPNGRAAIEPERASPLSALPLSRSRRSALSAENPAARELPTASDMALRVCLQDVPGVIEPRPPAPRTQATACSRCARPEVAALGSPFLNRRPKRRRGGG